MIVPFGSWEPDGPALDNSGVAKNAVPHLKSYKPFPSLSAYSSALSAYCRGAFTAVDTAGSVSQYAGDATKLYRMSGMTMTDASGATYTTATDSYWEFIKWGNKCLATNYDDAIQSISIGGTNFANLAATAPKARHITAVRDFVVVGNTNDETDGVMPNRVRWSGFNDETSWTVSASTQADYQDLQGNGGAVQAVVGGERGVVFQERAIWLMTYIGSPIVFQFDQVEDARGALAPRGVIPVGNMIFYIADDGFYMFAGGQSIPIGANKVDKTFLSDLNASYLYRVSGAAFPKDKVVIWSYPGSGSADGTPNKVIMYNWSTQKWAYAEFDHELIFRAMSIGVTLEGLDTLGYTNLDTIPFSLDSKVWMGGVLNLAAFNTSHKLGYFTGTSLDATFETGEFQPIPGKRCEITEVVPLVDGGTHTVQIGTRETQAGTVYWSAVCAENSSGICPTRANSRYHRARVNVTGDFIDAIGIDVSDDKVRSVGSR